MTAPPTDLDLLLVAIAAIPTPWKKWPGGYPDRLDLALVDAVMSIRFHTARSVTVSGQAPEVQYSATRGTLNTSLLETRCAT